MLRAAALRAGARRRLSAPAPCYLGGPEGGGVNVSVRAALQAREERAGRAREGRAARTADVPTERRVLILVAGRRFFSWEKKTRRLSLYQGHENQFS